jgi:glycine/D-amino acid oxidase-like deaminating enzyme
VRLEVASTNQELPATSSQLKALSWHCFRPFDSSPDGEPVIGKRIRQVADFSPLEAGG